MDPFDGLGGHYSLQTASEVRSDRKFQISDLDCHVSPAPKCLLQLNETNERMRSHMIHWLACSPSHASNNAYKRTRVEQKILPNLMWTKVASRPLRIRITLYKAGQKYWMIIRCLACGHQPTLINHHHYRQSSQVLRRLTAVASLNETWAIPAAHTVGRFRKGSALAEKAEKVFLTHMVRVVNRHESGILVVW